MNVRQKKPDKNGISVTEILVHIQMYLSDSVCYKIFVSRYSEVDFLTTDCQKYRQLKRRQKNIFCFEVILKKSFANFTEKHLSWSLCLMKPATLLQRDSNIGVFQ